MRVYFFLFLFLILQLPEACDRNESVDLELDKDELILEVGSKDIIKVTKAPNTGEAVVWSSDNDKVVSVFFGTITALAPGTAIIKATLGELVDSCVVTVPEREYELVWSDEFDGSSLNTDNWTYETGTGSWGWGNNEKEYYTSRSENIRVENGMLVIEARKESYSGSSYTSARIKSLNKQEFAYGKIEARLRLPKGAGTWPAFWMLGKVGSWPGCGEIDIMEHVGKEPKNIHCALHTLNKNGMNGKNFSATQTLEVNAADDFHVITLEWIENEFQGYDRMHFYVDGVETATFGETAQLQDSKDWPFNTPFFFIINLAIGGNWGGTIDDTMFDNPVLYQIDYIRVYQYK
ncbi:MAG: family 16 glycosylhydrolase [Bacteroidota bacterium]